MESTVTDSDVEGDCVFQVSFKKGLFSAPNDMICLGISFGILHYCGISRGSVHEMVVVVINICSGVLSFKINFSIKVF